MENLEQSHIDLASISRARDFITRENHVLARLHSEAEILRIKYPSSLHTQCGTIKRCRHCGFSELSCIGSSFLRYSPTQICLAAHLRAPQVRGDSRPDRTAMISIPLSLKGRSSSTTVILKLLSNSLSSTNTYLLLVDADSLDPTQFGNLLKRDIM